MNVKKLSNIFTPEEIEILNSKLDYSLIPRVDNSNYASYKNNSQGIGVHEELGRLQFGGLEDLPESIIDKINNIAKDSSDIKLSLSHAMAVEYGCAYGLPNLPVHYDHDNNDLIINFQLSSNTRWDIGIDLEVYELEDNSAVVFNANEYTHWRPHKTFKDGEFIKMIFFRFMFSENPSNYADLNYNIGDEVFAKINKFRDSFKQV